MMDDEQSPSKLKSLKVKTSPLRTVIDVTQVSLDTSVASKTEDDAEHHDSLHNVTSPSTNGMSLQIPCVNLPAPLSDKDEIVQVLTELN